MMGNNQLVGVRGVEENSKFKLSINFLIILSA